MSTSIAPHKARRRTAHADRRPPSGEQTGAVSARRHMAWLGIGTVVSFTVPFLLADQLDLQRDVYYGLYAAATLALCGAWMQDTHQSLRELISRR